MSVTVNAYVGYPRNKLSSCMRVISKNMNPQPTAAKKSAERPLHGKRRHTSRTATNGRSKNSADMSTAKASRSTSTRSPTWFSRSPDVMGWKKSDSTVPKRATCQKKGSLSVVGTTSKWYEE